MDMPKDNKMNEPREGLVGGLVRRDAIAPEWGDHALAPVGPQAPYGEGDAQPRQWPLSRILRFKWTMILTFVLVAAPAIAAVWLLVVPKYTAKAEVRVRPIIPHLVFKTDDNGMIPLYTSYMNTQVSIIRSPGVLGRVLDQKDVQETQWYKEPETSPFKPLLTPVERLRVDLSASPRGQTELIDVSMTSLKSSDAATIVNAVLDQYIVYVRERSDETSDLMYKKLTEEYDSLRSEIEGREKVIAKLRKELGTGTPDELVTKMQVRLEEADERLDALRQEVAILAFQEKQIAAILDSVMQQAAGQAAATATQGPRSKEDLANELESVRRRASLLKYQEQLLVEDSKKRQAKFEWVFESAQLIAKESKTLEHKRELYEAVRARLDQEEMERNVRGPIEVLTRASAPTSPSDDYRFLLTLVVLVVGVGAAVVILWRR